MSGLLSSFAISVAANIVTSLFSKNNMEKEIRTAFQDAIFYSGGSLYDEEYIYYA